MLVIQMVSSKVVYQNHMLVGTCHLDLTLNHLFLDHIGFQFVGEHVGRHELKVC